MAPQQTYKLPTGEVIEAGTLVLIPWRNLHRWPAMVNKLTLGKTSKKSLAATYKFLPIWEGEYSFKIPISKIQSEQIYKPNMEIPPDADNKMRQAFESAREVYGYSTDKKLALFRNPPPKPEEEEPEQEKVEVEKKPKVKLGKRKLKQPERPHDDQEIGADGAQGEELISNASDDEDHEIDDELDAITNGDGIAPKPPKRIRQMKPNEIIFADALPTEFKSKDQVVLMRNPSGVGLWPALPHIISEEKGFATFELFPRSITKTRVARHQPKLVRTTDTQIFAIDEKKINSMIDFAITRDKNLHDALIDVRLYLQDNHRFEEKKQVDAKFKEQQISVDFAPQQQLGESSTLALDELRLTNTDGEKLVTKFGHSILHTLPKRQLQEKKLLQEKFALSRQDSSQNSTWMFNHRIYSPHFELSLADLTSEKVHDYFDKIWSGQTTCQNHEQFLKNMSNTRPYYPSSCRINGITGGFVSNQDTDSAIQEFFNWIDLSVKLPRMPTIIDKFRYAMEVMLKEACIFLLCEKRHCAREKAEKFLLDNQDYTLALERGYCIDSLKDKVLK